MFDGTVVESPVHSYNRPYQEVGRLERRGTVAGTELPDAVAVDGRHGDLGRVEGAVVAAAGREPAERELDAGVEPQVVAPVEGASP